MTRQRSDYPNYQISVRRKTYERLAEGLDRNAAGRIRPGALQKRADALINAALDRAEKESK